LGYRAGSYDVTFSLRATQVSKLNIQCVIMAVDAVNVYFRRKLGPNLLKDGSQDICEAKESNLRPVAGF